MTTICAVIKNNQITIGCDGQTNNGILKLPKIEANRNKLITKDDAIIGISGWSVVNNLLAHAITDKSLTLDFNGNIDLLFPVIEFHKYVKENFFFQPNSSDTFESLDCDFLIINKYGLFHIDAFRSVNKFKTFYAIGSGKEIALGALDILYDLQLTPEEMVKKAIETASNYDIYTGGDISIKTIEINP